MKTHIDPQQTEKYLSIIAPTGIRTFQTFDDVSERKSPSLAHIIHGSTPENITRMAQLNNKGAGIFMMINEGDGKGRKACNVVSIRALSIDLDEDGMGRLNDIYQQDFPKPRLVIESSPDKFHVYWLLNGPLPLDQFKQCQQMLIKRFGGDPSVNDLPRVLRLPGFIHRKGEPFMVKIHADHPDAPPLDVRWLLSQETSLPSPAAAFADYDALLAGLPQPELKAWLDEALSFIDPTPYNGWLTVGMALHQATSGSKEGLSRWIDWSRTADNFNEFSCRQKWKSFDPDQNSPVTLGSLYHLAREGGWVKESPLNLTDVGNGCRFARLHGATMKFIPEHKKWLFYKDSRWSWDTSGNAMRLAKQTTKAMVDEARKLDDDQRQRLAKHAFASENISRLGAMITLASCEPEVVLHQHQLDADVDKFGTVSGTIHLKTGTVSPSQQADFITKYSPVSASPPGDYHTLCPTWLAFLDKIMSGNQALIDYLQRAMGYSLTGHTSEQCFFFLFGYGANGKSTLLDIFQQLAGDYALAIDPETLMVKTDSGNATPELARLKGARLVVTSEIEEGKRLAENRIKQFTGGDILAARPLYADVIEFKPQFKIWMAGNHKPVIRDTTSSVWRRVHLIPFDVNIPAAEQDKKLDQKLWHELPGILRWVIDGAVAWYQHGLKPPAEILSAVEEYRSDMDIFGIWLTERCQFNPLSTVESSSLYQDYRFWCSQCGHAAVSQTRFSRSLAERGEFTKIKSSTTKWQGLELKSDPISDLMGGLGRSRAFS